MATGEKRSNLALKLNGHRPATEDDLIRWAWLASVKLQSYTPEALWDQPFRVPAFPFPRYGAPSTGMVAAWYGALALLTVESGSNVVPA